MSKKVLGFVIPIVGIALLLKYLQKGNRSNTTMEHKTVKEDKKAVKTPVKYPHGKLNERQENILNLFQKRDTLLPADIYAVAPNLSTRTLRRDMTKLVELGLVLQEGNTKDSRYILRK